MFFSFTRTDYRRTFTFCIHNLTCIEGMLRFFFAPWWPIPNIKSLLCLLVVYCKTYSRRRWWLCVRLCHHRLISNSNQKLNLMRGYVFYSSTWTIWCVKKLGVRNENSKHDCGFSKQVQTHLQTPIHNDHTIPHLTLKNSTRKSFCSSVWKKLVSQRWSGGVRNEVWGHQRHTSTCTSISTSFSASSGPKGPGVVGTWCETHRTCGLETYVISPPSVENRDRDKENSSLTGDENGVKATPTRISVATKTASLQ